MGLIKMRGSNRMRHGLFNLVKRLPNENLHMIEVGSYAGESAEIFAKSGKFSRICCVDAWDNDESTRIVRNGKIFPSEKAESRFDKIKDKYEIIEKYKMYSDKAASIFPSKSMDFVYLDARHNYESVLEDINLWLSIIKNDGWIGGHDFSLKFPGVFRAVTESFNRPITLFNDTSWLVKLK